MITAKNTKGISTTENIIISITSALTSNQPPAWFRVLQVGGGILSLTLSMLLMVIGYPVLAADTITILLSIALLTTGVGKNSFRYDAAYDALTYPNNKTR